VRVLFAVDVPDDFLERRCREVDEDAGECDVVTAPEEYLARHAKGIAEDELPIAFWGWPVSITVEVTRA
jgi:hypothetical protein